MVSSENATIAALLTCPSPGAIAVVAIAGPDTLTLLDRMLRHPQRDEPPKRAWDRPRRCRILDGNRFLDDALVTLIPGPRGVVAELCTHGGVRIVQRVLMLLQQAGATIVDAWQFDAIAASSLASHPTGEADDTTPLRAHAAVVRDIDRALVACRSRRLARWLLCQREILPPYLARLNHLSAQEKAAFHARSRVAIRLIEGVTIAIVGPPNAGKSTLANRLIGHDRVLTSDTPGTTRDWVSETALIDGWPVTLTDTAGIRDTSCAIESQAIARGKATMHAADLILVILDGALPPTQRTRQQREIRSVIPPDRSCILVVNKGDVMDDQVHREPADALVISARTGDGISALEARVSDSLGWYLLDHAAPTAICRHHLDALGPSTTPETS